MIENQTHKFVAESDTELENQLNNSVEAGLNASRESSVSLFGLTTSEIRERIETMGFPAYRGSQVAEWLFRKILPGQSGGYEVSFEDMVDLPADLRARLSLEFPNKPLTPIEEHKDHRDGTTKVLAHLTVDKFPIECVLLPDSKRVSACISTQAGCPMACTFCATGTQGLSRNLTAAEIVSQLLLLQSRSSRRISHFVLMGMGEPLLNYANTLQAIKILNRECGIAMRQITLSTVGIVPNIYKLAEENLQLTLAVSLHAPTDELRSSIVPVAKKYPLDKLMEACNYYAQETNRRLTFEYVLLKEVNDRPEDARNLVKLLRGVHGAVNVIPYNPTAVFEHFQRPEQSRINEFRRIVEDSGITITQRKERGQQIAAACGQLVTQSVRTKPSFRELPVVTGV